jgi:hypothetical protein
MPTLPDELKSSGVTRLVGQGEDYAADVVPECDKFALVTTYQFLKESIVNASVSVSTTAIELKAGASRLANRKTLLIQPQNGKIYIGGAGVTTATGFELANKQTFIIAVSEDVPVYAIAESSVGVRIIEGA